MFYNVSACLSLFQSVGRLDSVAAQSLRSISTPSWGAEPELAAGPGAELELELEPMLGLGLGLETRGRCQSGAASADLQHRIRRLDAASGGFIGHRTML